MVSAVARVLHEVTGSIPDDCSQVSGEEQCHYAGGLSLPSLRIISICAILVASVVGVFAPEMMRRLGLNREHSLFLIVKAFGAGIILSTGFMHMFPNAVAMFSNPCLGGRGYQWAGVITSVTVIFVQGFEFIVSKVMERKIKRDIAARANLNHEKTPADLEAQDLQRQQAEVVRASGDLNTMYLRTHTHPEGEHGHDHDDAIIDAAVRHESIALVLEAGIAVHSVLIGIALGVSKTACALIPLLIALVFHQLFEGFALGACLVAAQYRMWPYTWMGGLFSLTTPVGIAIGMGVQSNYRENSKANLAITGVFDSISAGILIYMALVDILATDFQTRRFHSSVKLQVGGFAAVLLGIAAMCIIGIWA